MTGKNSSRSRPLPRVAIVFDCFFPVNTGGGERVYRRLAEILTERGYEVDYVTRGQTDMDSAGPLIFNVFPVWAGDIYNSTGNRTLGGAFAFSFGVLKHLRKSRTRYDFVIVSSTPVLNIFAAGLALFAARTVIVADWLEVWPLRKWREYSGFLIGFVAFTLQFLALRIGGVITTNSSFTANRISSYRPQARPIILGLVDLVPSISLAEVGVGPEPEPRFVLFVGRHISDKQLHSLPRAVKHARQIIPGLTLKIVGSGPETESVRSKIIRDGHESFCSFEGRVTDEELISLMSRASVLVNPSRREGFGLVIVEAAALGTPSVVVLSDDNAAIELIEEGVNGFISPSVETQDLGDAIANAVLGGADLRYSTRRWFELASQTRGMEASADELLERINNRNR